MLDVHFLTPNIYQGCIMNEASFGRKFRNIYVILAYSKYILVQQVEVVSWTNHHLGTDLEIYMGFLHMLPYILGTLILWGFGLVSRKVWKKLWSMVENHILVNSFFKVWDGKSMLFWYDLWNQLSSLQHSLHVYWEF